MYALVDSIDRNTGDDVLITVIHTLPGRLRFHLSEWPTGGAEFIEEIVVRVRGAERPGEPGDRQRVGALLHSIYRSAEPVTRGSRCSALRTFPYPGTSGGGDQPANGGWDAGFNPIGSAHRASGLLM
jgi:hypothetical protein